MITFRSEKARISSATAAKDGSSDESWSEESSQSVTHAEITR